MAPKKAASPAKAAPKSGATPAKKAAPKAKATPAPKAGADGAPADPAAPPAEPSSQPQPTGADVGGPPPPADSIEGVLVALDWEAIPGREQFERAVLAEFKSHMSTLLSVFVFYCKASSDCVTAEQATRVHLAGLKKLSQHASLEGPLLPMDNIVRLFGKCAAGEMPAAAKDVAPTTMLDFRGFLSLCLQLAFYRQSPRAGLLAGPVQQKEGAKEPAAAPINGSVKLFMSEVLAKCHKTSSTFHAMLAADRTAQQVVSQYSAQLQEWRGKLVERADAEHAGDRYAALMAALEGASIVGASSVADPKDAEHPREVTLSALAARHAIIDAHEPSDVALGKMTYELPTLIKVIAQCADKKLDGLPQTLPLAWRVRACVQTLVGELSLSAAVGEAISSAPATQTASALSSDEIEAAQEAAIKKSWRLCWKLMVFKDLVGYPLWETQLHDVLQAAFPELHKIFTFYCGSSIAGSESIASATRIGVMEFLQFAKDTDICTKEYKVEDLTRQFYVANTQATMAKSSSADRNKMPKKGAGKGGVKKANAAAAAGKKSPEGAKKANAKKKAGAAGGQGLKESTVEVDQQLTLYEFVNAVVRIGFWRANPQWGSKYNKRELTPVPESVTLMLEELVLPKAKRDTSYEFKKVRERGAARARTPRAAQEDKAGVGDAARTARAPPRTARTAPRARLARAGARQRRGDPGGAGPVPREAAELAAPDPAPRAPPRQPEPAADVQDVGRADGRPRPRDARDHGAQAAVPEDGGRVVSVPGVADHGRRAHREEERARVQVRALDPQVPLELSALADCRPDGCGRGRRG